MRTINVSAQWTGESLGFVGTDSQGRQVSMGGEHTGPGQLLLLALSGCTGMDVLSILQKKRQRVEDVQVFITAHQEEEYPRPYHTIEIKFKVTGQDIDPKAVTRAIELSTKKYCVVGQTLHQSSKITTSFEIEAG
jgi:putative redox protein